MSNDARTVYKARKPAATPEPLHSKYLSVRNVQINDFEYGPVVLQGHPADLVHAVSLMILGVGGK